MTAADYPGLSTAEARRRLEAEGPNTLPDGGQRGTFAIALEVVREPMFLLLVAGTLIYLLLGDVREALVLAASIAGGHRRSPWCRSASPSARSRRCATCPARARWWCATARRCASPGAEVVRGDLHAARRGRPRAGRRAPGGGQRADARRVAAHRRVAAGGQARPARAVYSGTLVVKGQGRAEVTATGPRTEFGRIGASLAALDIEKTRLQSETARIVKVVAVVRASG